MRTSAAPTEHPDLNCACLRLRQASRRVSLVYDQHLRPADLRNTQFSLLAHLVNRTLTINELSEKLVMDPTTLNRNLKPLRDRKLLVVRVGEHDRRERVIALTPAGKALYDAALPHWRAAQRSLRAAIGAESYDALRGLLGQIQAAPLLSE